MGGKKIYIKRNKTKEEKEEVKDVDRRIAREIIAKGCECLGIEKEVLVSYLRTTVMCNYRFMFMRLLRDNTKLGLQDIAHELGRVDHATIFTGLKTFKSYFDTEDEYRNTFLKLQKYVLQ